MTDERIKTIFDHYSEESQLEKSLEELDELKEAVSALLKLNRSYLPKNSITYRGQREYMIDHIAEEIADAKIMLDQLEYGLMIEQRSADWREMKLNRQIKRIKDES